MHHLREQRIFQEISLAWEKVRYCKSSCELLREGSWLLVDLTVGILVPSDDVSMT